MRPAAAAAALLLVALVAPAAATPVPGGYGPCLGVGVPDVNNVTFTSGASALFGCSAYTNDVNYTFKLGSEPLLVQLLSINTEAKYDFVSLLCGDTPVWRVSGSSVPRNATVVRTHAGCDASVTFVADHSNIDTGFEVSAVRVDAVGRAVGDNRPVQATSDTPGFSYFPVAGRMVNHATVNVTLNVESFKGIKPPSLFVRQQYLPTLDNPGVMGSVPDGEHSVTVSAQPAAFPVLFVGVYSYGPSMDFELSVDTTLPTDVYPELVSGSYVNVTAAAGQYEWLQTPSISGGTNAISFELSRAAPGGSPPVAVICAGAPCNVGDELYVATLDTTTTTYASYKANNVYGRFVVGVSPSTADTTNGVFRATWGFQ